MTRKQFGVIVMEIIAIITIIFVAMFGKNESKNLEVSNTIHIQDEIENQDAIYEYWGTAIELMSEIEM